MNKTLVAAIISAFLIVSCGKKDDNKVTEENRKEVKQDPKKDQNPPEIKINSSAFEKEASIPKKYTCEGENVSPALSWEAGPSGTKSYALIVDDPDAPSGTVVHWVAYNIPAGVKELPEGAGTNKKPADGTMQGMNEKKNAGYMGPCPPSGIHRYYFKIYALDTMLDLKGDVNKDKLVDAIKGHVVAQGELMGKYSKQ